MPWMPTFYPAARAKLGKFTVFFVALWVGFAVKCSIHHLQCKDVMLKLAKPTVEMFDQVKKPLTQPSNPNPNPNPNPNLTSKFAPMLVTQFEDYGGLENYHK
jgi:hypothetical protein